MIYGFDETKAKVNLDAIFDQLETNYQNNVNTIYNALVSNGVTPTAKTPAAIVTAINSVRSGGNATAAQILSTKTAYVNKSLVTGSMTNRGAWTGTGTPTGNNTAKVTIPAGYHNGSGYVTANGATSYAAGVSAQKAVHWNEEFVILGTGETRVNFGLYNVSSWKVTSKSTHTSSLVGAYLNSSGGSVGNSFSISVNTSYTPPTGAVYINIYPYAPSGYDYEVKGQFTRYADKLR